MAKSSTSSKPRARLQVVPVAYEDRRRSGDRFEVKVERYLQKMGVGDPAEAVARRSDYVARARDAELDPQVVASTIYTLDHPAPPREPAGVVLPGTVIEIAPSAEGAAGATAAASSPAGVGTWAGEDRRPLAPGYYAVGADNRIVAGPFPARYKAEPHAQAARGYIQFEPGQPGEDVGLQPAGRSGFMGAAEQPCHCPPGPCAHRHPPSVPSTPCAGEPAPAAADCGCKHAAPLARPLRWHRDDKDGGYFAESALGRFTLREQTSNRRQGVLAWDLRLDGAEMVSADTATAGKGWAQTYGTMVPAAAAGEPVVIRDAGKMTARPTVGGKSLAEGCRPFMRTYRDPEACAACMAVGQELGPIDSPKKVYELLRGYYMKQHQEVYIVVMLNVRDELVGIEEVARGQRSQVAVDFDDIYRPVNMAAASSFWAVHGHPSGTADPSRRDRQLTKTIVDAMKYHPDTKFRGHVVIGAEGYELA